MKNRSALLGNISTIVLLIIFLVGIALSAFYHDFHFFLYAVLIDSTLIVLGILSLAFFFATPMILLMPGYGWIGSVILFSIGILVGLYFHSWKSLLYGLEAAVVSIAIGTVVNIVRDRT